MKYKLGIDSQSKSVTAHAEVEGDDGDLVAAEVIRLHKVLEPYTLQATMVRNR